jgi:tetratricopeptide (TPR) repeat protein
MKNKKHLYQSIYKILPVLLILFLIQTAVIPETALAKSSVASRIGAADDDDVFGERFREGRDLIDKGEWARATEKFREALEKYPDHKSADAALYWLAFCYKKQKKYKEADAALDRLLEKFPNSSWTGDARVMKVEIAPWISRLGVLANPNINSNVEKGKFSSDLKAKIIKGTVDGSVQNSGIDDVLNSEKVPLDRQDEIKIAAFQSLLVADPKRAIETMGEILKPDSKTSEILKQEILRVLRSPRVSRNDKLYFAGSGIGKEFLPLLRETLTKSFQNERNIKIRKELIYSLASLPDNQSTDYLKNLYAAESDREVKKAIISSIGSPASGFYASGSDTAPGQKATLNAAREQNRKIGQDILLEIISTEKDLELRRLAFANLRRFQNWMASGQAVDIVTRLYDAETDEELKISLIRAFAESKQKAATGKLMDIARNDRSDKLRLEAIYSLRNSKDPEVIKFLEDLIR